MSQDDRISVRIPKSHRDIKERLRKAAELCGVSETDLVISAVIGACDYIEKFDCITMPIQFSSESARERAERFAQRIHAARKKRLRR